MSVGRWTDSVEQPQIQQRYGQDKKHKQATERKKSVLEIPLRNTYTNV